MQQESWRASPPLLAQGAGADAGALAGAAGASTLATAIPLFIGGKFVAFASLFVWTLLGGIVITELVCLIAMKAIQQILLIAQYMFAPIFIVFFAAPDTESFTVKYMYGFVIVNLWSFFWVGALRILVILLNSHYIWWGKPLLLIGALTLMIYAPAFMMGGVINPTSPFLDPRNIMNTLTNGFGLVGGLMAQGVRSLYKETLLIQPLSITRVHQLALVKLSAILPPAIPQAPPLKYHRQQDWQSRTTSG